jgi:hypothetical protein
LDYIKFPCLIIDNKLLLNLLDYFAACLNSKYFDKLKKCNYVHQSAIFHRIRELSPPSQPQQHQMHRDYENINTRAQLNRLMHSVLEMIY